MTIRRMLILLICFGVLAGTIAFVLLTLNEKDQETRQIIQHPRWKSNEDPAHRPFATRDGRKIKLFPSGVMFEVPLVWVEWYQQGAENFHLSHEQLDAVSTGAGEWDSEFASVFNAVLPYDRCAAQIGGDWGHGGTYAYLHLRVYDLEEVPESVERRIEIEGIADIQRFSKKPPQKERETISSWRKFSLSFWRFYIDYGAEAQIDFRIRNVQGRTFVFVFMTTDYKHNAKTISEILDSFAPK